MHDYFYDPSNPWGIFASFPPDTLAPELREGERAAKALWQEDMLLTKGAYEHELFSWYQYDKPAFLCSWGLDLRSQPLTSELAKVLQDATAFLDVGHRRIDRNRVFALQKAPLAVYVPALTRVSVRIRLDQELGADLLGPDNEPARFHIVLAGWTIDGAQLVR